MKKVLFFLLVCLFAAALTTGTYALNFSDVPSKAWYEKDLEDAVSKGLIKGVDGNRFAPAENITYAQFVSALVRVVYGEQPNTPDGIWYSGYVKKAVKMGIADSNTPWDEDITRGMTALYLCRALKIFPENKVEMIFADCNDPVSNNSVMKYYLYLVKAYKEYLLDGTTFGTGDDYFKKNTDHLFPVTRAELATIITRAEKYKTDAARFKSERAEVRDAEFAKRRAEYEKLVGLKYQTSSDHFDYYLNDTDTDVLEDITKRLEKNYSRITNDLKANFGEKVRVLVYPDLTEFHNAIGLPNAQDWVIGSCKPDQIMVVSPLNPGSAHTYESVMSSVIRQFTNVTVMSFGGNYNRLPKWLMYGVAFYEEQQMDDNLKYSMLNRTIPSFSQMETTDNLSFSNMGGYAFSYTIIEYIVKKYNMDKVVDLIKNPADFEGIFGISKDEFETQWMEFVQLKYQ